jgi:hypothetical protein
MRAGELMDIFQSDGRAATSAASAEAVTLATVEIGMAEQMFLIEAMRTRRGDRPAAIARFVLTAGSTYAALSKLRAYYDTSDLDSITAVPLSGVVPIAGTLAHEMQRRPAVSETEPILEFSGEEDDEERWRSP